jgi:hypothetical protein
MENSQLSTMPDMAAETALSTGADPAEEAAAAGIEPEAVCDGLGKVQIAILKASRAVTLGDETVREDQLGWFSYGRLPDEVPKFGYVAGTESAHRSSVSRSVKSLAEKKYLAAAVKEWHRFYGMEESADEANSLLSFGAEPWRRFDDERSETPSPKFTYIRLTAPGHKLARHLLAEGIDS